MSLMDDERRVAECLARLRDRYPEDMFQAFLTRTLREIKSPPPPSAQPIPAHPIRHELSEIDILRMREYLQLEGGTPLSVVLGLIGAVEMTVSNPEFARRYGTLAVSGLREICGMGEDD